MAELAGGRVEDDCVEYFLFPLKDNDQTKEKLDELSVVYTAHLSDLLFGYIWQNEPFKLTPVSDVSSSTPPHLYGCTRYGDNVEDEWFIVFLLAQLTKTFPELVVRIIDNDGEFLLIEAADFLKKWMNPESCEKRVYLYRGNIHIIPLSKSFERLPSLLNGVPAYCDALAAICECQSATKADVKIQKAIERRISGFPDSIKENYHRAHCYLPASAATILQARPVFLSAAVQAFYHRDPVDLKACKAMKYFPPETRVMTEVTFTKCLYAQLMQQKFIPDKRVGWALPTENCAEYKAHALGMKLACGLEILASRCSLSKMAPEVELSTDFDTDVRWNCFLKSLVDKGYFRGFLEHSKPYNECLEKARLYYEMNLCQDECREHFASDELLKLLNSLEVDLDQLKRHEKTLKPPDDDGWLTVTPVHLDNILSSHFSGRVSLDDENGHAEKDVVDTVPSSLKNFVGHVSSHEGAEFPKMRNKKASSNKSNRITFDPDSFADAMQSILDFKVPDWDGDDRSSSSGMSDYSDEDGNEPDLSKPNTKLRESSDFASEMTAYMDEMDRELAGTKVGQSFERSNPIENTDNDDVDDDEDGYKPIDLNLTALKNILESYSAQQGLPGPASNLLGSMGIQLPQDADK